MKKLDAALMVLAALLGRGVSAQCQVQKLVASDAAADDRFGGAIAASGEWLVVGAHGDDDLGIVSGAAYLYQRQASTWVEFRKLRASEGGSSDQFGYAVGISGDTVVITAPFDSPIGVTAAGSVYVFERSGATWTETEKLVANDASPDDNLGKAVAISGNRIVVGTPDDDPFFSGSAYVFEKVGNTWMQTAKLIASDAALSDGFGSSVAIEGDSIVIGSSNDDGPTGQSNTGSAYVFENVSGSWVERQKLIPSDPAANQFFGTSVSISGVTLLVGASQDSTAGAISGSAYAFEKQGSTWIQTQELTATDSNPQNMFGSFLTHVGTTAIIGALSDSDNGFVSGSAYVFQRSGSTWLQTGKMLARDGKSGDLLGISLALVGDEAIVGAHGDDDVCLDQYHCDSGAVYVFELAPTAVQYGMCKPFSACGNIDDHGGCDIAGGTGSVLAACGSGSVSIDDLRLELTNSRPNKLTLLFMGPAQSQVIYGNGVRVAGPQNPTIIYRFGGATADAQGRVLRGPGLVAYSQGFPPLGRIQSGQTWNFQFWFRDPGGWCGANTNFSNGVSVGFGP